MNVLVVALIGLLASTLISFAQAQTIESREVASEAVSRSQPENVAERTGAQPKQPEVLPRVLDERLRLELFAESPSIVTPIAMTFDQRGRLLVVESHTHQPDEEYAGPKHDRIRILEDHDRDGKADRFSTFFEGTTHTMSMMTYVDGSIYVATRMQIFRLRDLNDDGKADERRTLIRLETPGDYPHNGLSGLTYNRSGEIYFGFGENLGEPYRLIGADGTVLSGGAEGGGVYRCDANGQGLRRVATGLWNPFDLCFDSRGRLFAVDNDPDGRPPCRLLQIANGGDYGYQFRYGRTGQHPLQAWDGELPGTLPMCAGTGEAPSAALPYHGQLWVTSWGDHRIERFTLQPRGASCQATVDFVVQGDNNFRPVDLTIAPDGSLYLSDWVDRSYPVHGQGRIWRLVWRDSPPEKVFPDLSDEERQARQFETDPDTRSLDVDDPFLRQATVWGMIQSNLVADADWRSLPTSSQRLGALQAMRWLNPDQHSSVIPFALHDTSPKVRLFAVRWIADLQLDHYREELNGLLQSEPMTLPLFKAIVAADQWLEHGEVPKDRDYNVKLLVDSLLNDELAADVRVMALRLLPSDNERLSSHLLKQFLHGDRMPLQIEAVRTLAFRQDAESQSLLADIAGDPNQPITTRADALVGLAHAADRHRDLLLDLAKDENQVLRREAMRSLSGLDVGLNSDIEPDRPAAGDIDAWLELLGERGNAEIGRRVFFSPKGANCGRCHRYGGRGQAVGPELTGIGRQMTRRRLLESVLLPNREVAPRYSPWLLETNDGEVHTGLSMRRPYSGENEGISEQFIADDGTAFILWTRDIASRRQLKTSIMPSGLEQNLTLEDIRDLLAFLRNE